MTDASVFTAPVQPPAVVDAMVRRNLRLVRRSRGLSAVKVAEALGMGRATPAAHESGRRALTVLQVERYARFHGVTVQDLFDPALLVRLPRRPA